MPVNGLTQDVQDVVLSLMEGLATPRAVAVAILLRYNEWGTLVKLKCNPAHYTDSEDFFRDYQATALLAKYADVSIPGIDPEATAIEKWWAAERDCFLTNRRLDRYVDTGDLSLHDDYLGSKLLAVRSVLKDIVGKAPKELDGFFGPGATLSDKSRFTTVPDKMSSVPSLTPDQWPLLSTWVGTKWGRAHLTQRCVDEQRGRGTQDLSLVRGNVFFSVPKNAQTHRACAKEPSIPAFYQLGLGRVLRRRLLKKGIDLKEGQTTHRQVACTASSSGKFATIDLSSASDTISKLLVKVLWPIDWFEQLNLCRSPLTFIQGKWVRLEKFSSMGNGYTFELETATFAAIALVGAPGCVLGRDIFVYGDDIIVPTEHAQEVMNLLGLFGFSLNTDKTFVEGSFRESCGGDYFEGVGVRPYQLKESPNEPQQIIAFANGLRRTASQYGSSSSRLLYTRRSWFKLLDLLPTAIRCCHGPSDLGDIVIHDDEQYWQCRSRASIRYLRCYRPVEYRKVRWEGFSYEVQFAAALYGVTLMPLQPIALRSDGLDGRYLIPRDGVTGYKVGWVPFS